MSLLIRKQLTDRARDFNIILDDVSITELSFGKEYAAAVEAKQIAQQEAQRAAYLVEKARQEKQHAAQTKKEETTSLLPSLEVDKFNTYQSMLFMIYFRLLLIFVWKKKYQLLPLGGPSPPYLTPPSACPGWRQTGPGPGCSACPGWRCPCPWPGVVT